MENIHNIQNRERCISKAIFIHESALTTVPKRFAKQLGVKPGVYFEHKLTEDGLLTRVIELPSGDKQ